MSAHYVTLTVVARVEGANSFPDAESLAEYAVGKLYLAGERSVSISSAKVAKSKTIWKSN